MSLKQIKELTGFSYSTISRVLTGKAEQFRISKQTCRKILKAAEKVNYRPNLLARSLRLKKTMTVGLMVSDIQNPFFGELGSKIEGLLRDLGYSTILCNTNELPENEELYLKVLEDRQVDGIILVPVHTTEWVYMKTMIKKPPIVLLDRVLTGTKLPWVTSENTIAAERLTEELINFGYKRIAFLGGKPNTYISQVRYQGYKNALKKKGIKIDKDIVIFQGYSLQAGEQMMQNVLKIKKDIDAVFCVNNLVFFGAVRVVREFERLSSRSIMMAGFDISHYSYLFDRPLLSADQDIDALANSTVQILISLINKESPPQKHVILPVAINKYGLKQMS